MSIPESKDEHRNIFSEWLDQLQQESWQLELLISGLALFGIWESRFLIDDLDNYFDVNGVSSLVFYQAAILFILRAGWAIFFTNLLIHIIIRGLWIGAIGLRYVSGDIDFEKLNYSPTFENYYRNKIGSFDEYVERLEKLSSVLFSYTFLLFFMFVSLVSIILSFSLAVLLFNRIGGEQTSSPAYGIAIFSMIYFGLGFLVFLDFITLGVFKRITDKTVSNVYLAIYRFYGILSFSFIYRPLLLNFIDNRYTRKLFFLAIPYALVILLSYGNVYTERYTYLPSFTEFDEYLDEIGRYSVNWLFYDDLRAQHITRDGTVQEDVRPKKIFYASLDQFSQEGPTASLFLEFRRNDDEMIKKRFPDLIPFLKKGFRHRNFFSNKVKDPNLESIEQEERSHLNYLRNLYRGNESRIDSTSKAKFGDFRSLYTDLSEVKYNQIRRDLRSEFSLRRQAYVNDKLQESLEAIKSLYKVQLDDQPIDDSLKCFFYTHPNLGERGLKCMIDIDDLEPGMHYIHITKTNYRRNCELDCPVRKIVIPFEYQ